MAQGVDCVEIVLKNGGWDGMGHKQFIEYDPHAVASRVCEMAKELVTDDAGLVFRGGNLMGIVQRETANFRFLGKWIDLRLGDKAPPMILADDDRNQIGAWSFNVARAILHAIQLGRVVEQMNIDAAQRARLVTQVQDAKAQGLEFPTPPIPAPPPGMSALQFMQQLGRIDPAWVPATPSTDQVAPQMYPVNAF